MGWLCAVDVGVAELAPEPVLERRQFRRPDKHSDRGLVSSQVVITLVAVIWGVGGVAALYIVTNYVLQRFPNVFPQWVLPTAGSFEGFLNQLEWRIWSLTSERMMSIRLSISLIESIRGCQSFERNLRQKCQLFEIPSWNCSARLL